MCTNIPLKIFYTKKLNNFECKVQTILEVRQLIFFSRYNKKFNLKNFVLLNLMNLSITELDHLQTFPHKNDYDSLSRLKKNCT